MCFAFAFIPTIDEMRDRLGEEKLLADASGNAKQKQRPFFRLTLGPTLNLQAGSLLSGIKQQKRKG